MSQILRVIEMEVSTEDLGVMTIKGLKMSFKAIKSTSNKISVEITNLSEDIRNRIDKIDENKKNENLLTVKVGYEGEPIETLFFGNITYFKHKYVAPEVTTVIEAEDGGRKITNTLISISFEKKSDVRKIIKKIVKISKWETKNDIEFIVSEDKELTTGYSFNGQLKHALDELTGMIGIEWSFQNGLVKFLEKGKNDSTKIIVVSERTGMIGVPEKTNKKGTRIRKSPRKKEKPSKFEPGYVVKSLIKPLAEPGGRMRVISKRLSLDDVFTIGDVEHTGDNFDNVFETKAKVLI